MGEIKLDSNQSKPEGSMGRGVAGLVLDELDGPQSELWHELEVEVYEFPLF